MRIKDCIGQKFLISKTGALVRKLPEQKKNDHLPLQFYPQWADE